MNLLGCLMLRQAQHDNRQLSIDNSNFRAVKVV